MTPWLGILEAVLRRHHRRSPALCVMATHYHLLIGTPGPTLSTSMRTRPAALGNAGAGLAGWAAIAACIKPMHSRPTRDQ